MPFPLHKAAAGLLGLLNLKQLGRSPNLFSEQVLGTVELSQMYGLPLLVSEEATNTTSLSQTTVRNVVPAGEVWRVHSVGGIFIAPAGWDWTSNYLCISAEFHPGGVPCAPGLLVDLSSVLPNPLVDVEEFRHGFTFPGGRLLAPGMSVGTCFAYESATVSPTLISRVAFERLPQ